MNRLSVSLVILSLITFSSWTTDFVHGYRSCYLFNLDTDKDFYYYYEYINVSATWETDYIDDEEIYVQIKLFDVFENLKWNSSENNEKGLIARNWTISIQELNLSMINNPTILSLKFYRHYKNFIDGEENEEFLKTIVISVVKNDIICDLEGFNNTISYGERLEFNAKFSYLSNRSGLTNEKIKFLILFENNVILQQNLTSNDDGMITINISTSNSLRIGKNDLKFEIIDLGFVNNSIFQYRIIVLKSKIFIDIIEFKNEINFDDSIEIMLKFYYINHTIRPLANENIILNIYKDSNLKAQLNLKTNSTGHLSIFLNPSEFDINDNKESISILLNYYGSNFFENATISFQLTIYRNYPQVFEQFDLIIIISTVSLIGLTTILIFYFKHNKDRKKIIKFKDITFKF